MNKATKDIKHSLIKNRIEHQEIKDTAEGKLGDPTTTVQPEDIAIMFAGKLVNEMLKQSVASRNMLKAFVRSYAEIYPTVEEELEKHRDNFQAGFDHAKKELTKLAKNHPLALKLCQIKGFTPYQLALVMAHIKDIGRFATPSKLMVYAGVGTKYGLKVCKRNINKIREIKHREYTGDPENFTEFGYNTALQGRMYVIGESLLRARGYFYEMYNGVRMRLVERALAGEECFVVTAEQAKGTKMKAGEHYMKGRKNQSLKAWTHSNAMSRVQRTLLHLIYKEWRELAGLPVRNPYPIDYLGHQKLITLEDVLANEQAN